MRLRYLVFICLLFSTLALRAQDSSDTKTPKKKYIAPNTAYFTEQDWNEGKYNSYKNMDTSLDFFHRYKPLARQFEGYQDLGNIGSAAFPIIFDSEKTTGFNWGFHAYDHYLKTPETVKYFDTHTPYTNLYYVQGPGKLLYLKAIHSQNIGKYFNWGVHFSRIVSEGFYQRQKTKHTNTQPFVSYHGKNNHYRLLANATWNRYKIQENGGLASDSLFETGLYTSVQLPINLQEAEIRYKENIFYLKQYYGFGKMQVKDRIKPHIPFKGSIELADTGTYLSPTFLLSHSIKFTRRGLAFDDNLESSGDIYYYPRILLDSVKTYDTLSFKNLENELTLLIKGDKQYRGIEASLIHSLFQVNQNGILGDYDNMAIKGSFFNRFVVSKRFALTPEMKQYYVFHGYNASDYLTHLSLKSLSAITDQMAIEGTILAKQQLYSPSFIQNHFYENHFQWNNNFNQTLVNSLEGKLIFQSWKTAQDSERISIKTNRNLLILKAGYNQFKNYIYYDSLAKPQQFAGVISVLSASLEKKFKLGNFYSTHYILFQQADKRDILRIPKWVTRNSVYYENKIFKKGMLAQIGLDIYYNSYYFANAYMPASGQFYLQNRKKTGNYPFIDLFFNAQIKRANIFIKMEHVNQKYSGYNYYVSPNYLSSNRTIRLGINWRFYD